MTSPHLNPPKSSNRLDSFRHALAGWRHLVRTTTNARIELAFALAALAAGLWLRIGFTEWAVIWLVIGLIFAAESLNTALEAVVDLASPEVHPLAGAAKDVAAGGVLFAACAAVMVGLFVFGPPLVAKLWPLLAGIGR